MKYHTIVTWLFGENIYLLWDEATLEAVVIDPGMMKERENDELMAFIDDNHLNVKAVWLTHGHVDHACGARWIADRLGVPVMGSALDQPLLSGLPLQVSLFKIHIDAQPLTLDRNLADGDVLHIGEQRVLVIAMPGHSPGGLAFYLPDHQMVFTGDSLFQGSIGRTDLMGGDYDTLISSIQDNLLTLPPETVVISGHGPTTTIGHEATFNPYL